ncbi:unnamed protein product [Polarella glacialis]|uniref:Uncharacterized protein n=1 Tax=Polarella glacialis TaxID=89957 RepID=A0A813KLQ2_POLGL|nr:unnamed protein product [Polarella glacialis]
MLRLSTTAAPASAATVAPVRVPPGAFRGAMRQPSPQPWVVERMTSCGGGSSTASSVVVSMPVGAVTTSLTPRQIVSAVAHTAQQSAQPVQVKPSGILSRIDGVVFQMEQELSNVRALSGSAAEVESISSELQAASWHEEEEEEKYEARLKDLFSLVGSQGSLERPSAMTDTMCLIEDSTEGEDGLMQELMELRSWRADRETRLQELIHHNELLELDYGRRISKAQETALAAEERARLAEDAHGRLLQAKADFEAEASEAVKAREQQLLAEADKAKAQAERDFDALDESSQAVLADCRRLQTKVRELEKHEALEKEEQKSFRARNMQLEEQLARQEAHSQEQEWLVIQHKQTLFAELQLQARRQGEEQEAINRTLEKQVADIESQLTVALCGHEDDKKRLGASKLQVSGLHDELAQLRSSFAELEATQAQRSVDLEGSLSRSKSDAQAAEEELRVRLTEVEDELDEARRDGEAQEGLMADLRQHVADLEAELGEVREHSKARQQALEADLQQLGAQQHLEVELRQRLASLEAELAGARSSGEEKLDLLEMLTQRVACMEDAEKAHQSVVAQLQKTISELDSELSGALSTSELLQKSKEDVAFHMTALKSELASSQKSKEEAAVHLTALKSELASARSDGEVLERKQAELHQQLASKEAEFSDVSCEIQVQITITAELKIVLEAREAELAEVRTAADSHQSLATDLRGQLAGLESELSVAHASGEKQQSSLEGECQSLQCQVDEYRALELDLRQRLAEADRNFGTAVGSGKAELEEVAVHLTALKSELASARSDGEVLERKQAELHQQLASKEAEFSEVSCEIQVQITITAELKIVLEAREAELAEVRNAADSHQSLATDLRGQLAGLESELSVARASGEKQQSSLEVQSTECQSLLCQVDEYRALELDLRQRRVPSPPANHAADRNFGTAVGSGKEATLDELEAQRRGALSEPGQRPLRVDTFCLVAELRGRVAELEFELGPTLGELCSCEFQEAEHRQRAASFEAEVSGARSSGDAQQRLGQELKLRLAEVDTQFALSRSSCKEKQSQLEDLTLHVAALQITEKTQQTLVADLKRTMANLEAELAATVSKGEGLERDKEEGTVHLTTLKGELAAARSDGEALERQQAELQTHLDAKEAELSEACGNIEVQLAMTAEFKDVLAARVAELQEARAAIQSQEKLVAELSGRLEMLETAASFSKAAKQQQHFAVESLMQQSLTRLESRSWGVESRSSLQGDSGSGTGDGESVLAVPFSFASRAQTAEELVLATLHRAGEAVFIGLELAQVIQRRDPTCAGSRMAKELEEPLDVLVKLLGEDKEIRKGLGLYLELLQDELRLLTSDSALTDLPWGVQRALAKVAGLGAAVDSLSSLDEGSDEEDLLPPMHWAARHGRRDVVDFLLRPLDRAPSTPGASAVGRAGGEGGYLRENGSLCPIPPAHWAAERGDAELCTYLLDLGADASSLDGRGRSPTDCASKCANLTRRVEVQQTLSDTIGGEFANRLACPEEDKVHDFASQTGSEDSRALGTLGNLLALNVRERRHTDGGAISPLFGRSASASFPDVPEAHKQL